MKSKLIIALFFFTINFYPQHTARFLKVTNNLHPVDSIVIKEKHKNGNLKRTVIILNYRVNKKDYKFYSGFHRVYLKNGNLLWEIKHDPYGNRLYYREMNLDGNLSKEIITTLIDTSSEDLSDFLSDNRKLIIETYEKKYRLSRENKPFLRKEMTKRNGKKTGIWKKYNYYGDIIKTKDFSKRSKPITTKN